jgi:hypothetical protein
LKKQPTRSVPFGTQIAKMQHFSNQEWEVAKNGSRRKAVCFGVRLAVIPGKHNKDFSRWRRWSEGLKRRFVYSVIESSTTGTVGLL